MTTKILFAGGGTGGHVYPLVAVAEEVAKTANETGVSVRIKFIGSGDILKKEAVRLNQKFASVLSPKWRRYFSLMNFLDLILLPIAFLQSFFVVWAFMPDIIFSKGGFASFLPSIAGRLMGIPLIIHETDTIPGAANRFLSKFARMTFTAVETARHYFGEKNSLTVGNPIRVGLLAGGDKAAALAVFKLDAAKPTVLITGASQGAKKINDILLLTVVELVKRFQIIHQTGPKNFEEINRQVDGIIKEGKDTYGQMISANYRAYPMFDLNQMAAAYAACDVIVSRSGGQIFETAAVGKPTVLIPLKISSGDHQRANAREIAKFGAIVIDEDNLSPHVFINEIQTAYNRRDELSEKIKGFARLDAASIIARQLLTN